MGTLVLAGRYEIIEKIGDGGMAVVYKARDKQLNRFVAIKILKKEFIADQTFVENFIREAKAAASLLHPNIVTIHDAGKDRDIYYIVMEYVEGRALSDVIAAEAPLDYKRCIRIAKQIASALSLAHRNNIVHRDVKPHNILITADGTAKITDFGIAKAVSDGTIINDSGIIMGSVHYFSPEQSRGQYVDEKSDIYSLGIVLYEMITGRVPFDADNPVTIAVMHMNESIIPPSRLVRGVPPGLDQIVMKATAKYQSDRFGNIEEMYKALDNVNFITGIIDDPEIAGYVMPTNIVEETPGQGYSNAAAPAPEDGLYTDDGYTDEEPDYRRPRRGKEADYEDDEDDEEDGRKRGLFGGLFGGGAAAAEDKGEREGDYEGERKSGSSRGKLDKKQKLMLIIAVVVIAIIISIPLSKVILGMFSYEPVEVPDVVGMMVDEATEILTDEGFSVAIDIVPLPPLPVYLPPDAGDDTTDLAGGLLYEPDPVSDDEPSYSEGEVMEQDPEGGTPVKPGSKVTLTVAGAHQPNEEANGNGLTQELLEVPDVIGKTKAAAEYAIGESGFRPSVNYENSDMPIDTVFNQSPKGGEMAPGNSLVYIVISLGPKENMVTVPKLVGLKVEDALKLAEEGKFILNITEKESDKEKGTILEQSPAEGGTVKEGGTVNVTISSGPKAAITSFSISPKSATINDSGGTQQFSVDIKGTGEFSKEVKWTLSGAGSLNSSGLYKAPTAPGAYSATITVTSADGTKKDTASVSGTIPTPMPTTFHVTVTGGTGSGDYTAGATVSITAVPPDGQVFDCWEGGPVDGSTNSTETFTMPASNVTVTAKYKDE